MQTTIHINSEILLPLIELSLTSTNNHKPKPTKKNPNPAEMHLCTSFRLSYSSWMMSTIPRTIRLELARCCHLLQKSHASFTTASKGIDFHALEAKWKVRWAAKENKQDQKRDYWPLAPLRLSMLGVRKPYGYNRCIQVKYHPKKEHQPFDSLLAFAMPKDSDEFLKLCESDPQLKLRIPVTLSLILRLLASQR